MNNAFFRSMARVVLVASLLLATALSAFAAGGVASGQAPVSARDSGDRLLTLSAPALRVVSLSPAATEVVFAVGAGENLVGDTSYCDYPVAALKVAKVGGFSASTISIERIVAMKPDFVITAGTMHASVETALARLSIPVFAYDPQDFASIAAGIASLGVLCGKQAEGEAAAKAMLSSIEKVKSALAATPGDKRPSVFWEVYDEPLMTCGAKTFPHAILEAAGGRDIFSDLPGAWPRISGEEVLRRAPDYIMGADDHGDKLTVAAVAQRPGWAGVPAVKNGRIILISAPLVSRAGPRVADGVLAVAKSLYPAIFK